MKDKKSRRKYNKNRSKHTKKYKKNVSKKEENITTGGVNTVEKPTLSNSNSKLLNQIRNIDAVKNSTERKLGDVLKPMYKKLT